MRLQWDSNPRSLRYRCVLYHLSYEDPSLGAGQIVEFISTSERNETMMMWIAETEAQILNRDMIVAAVIAITTC